MLIVALSFGSRQAREQNGPEARLFLLPLQDEHVLVMTFLGLQDVQARYGLGSPEAQACKAAVKQALGWAVEQLDAALGGDVTYQVHVAG